AAAVDEHGRVHNLFWTAGEVAFGRAAVSGFLFRGAGSLAGIWIESRRAGPVATAFIIARPGHGTRHRVVAFRTERAVPSRKTCASVCGAALAACICRLVST